MKHARFYVENWLTMQAENIGYLLWGGVGTGKSYFAGCVANALMEQEVAVRMTNFARTTLRFLTTLAMTGYVAQEEDTSKYYLTYKIVSLGHKVNEGKQLPRIVSPYLKRIFHIRFPSGGKGICDTDGRAGYTDAGNNLLRIVINRKCNTAGSDFTFFIK